MNCFPYNVKKVVRNSIIQKPGSKAKYLVSDVKKIKNGKQVILLYIEANLFLKMKGKLCIVKDPIEFYIPCEGFSKKCVSHVKLFNTFNRKVKIRRV